MGLVVGLFINPDATVDAVRQYRERFTPSLEFPQPRVMIAVHLVCAATDDKLQELKKATDFLRLLRDSGRYPAAIPSRRTLQDVKFTADQQAYLERISNREVVGLPDDVRRRLVERAQRYEADEVLVTVMTYDLADKIETFRLLGPALS
jgi:alkanesulfonate monooxygenase SsuD/methylene tetrahydromethanopterin reductase-like flavin-dependent oxidoreductase (luciferase family)